MSNALLFNCDPINGIDMAIVELDKPIVSPDTKISLKNVIEKSHFLTPDLEDNLIPAMSVWKIDSVVVTGPISYIAEIAQKISAEYPNVNVIRKERN